MLFRTHFDFFLLLIWLFNDTVVDAKFWNILLNSFFSNEFQRHQYLSLQRIYPSRQSQRRRPFLKQKRSSCKKTWRREVSTSKESSFRLSSSGWAPKELWTKLQFRDNVQACNSTCPGKWQSSLVFHLQYLRNTLISAVCT